jgi:hypothetical protein
MNISFDFDGVLDIPAVQECAGRLITAGHAVFILTARFSDEQRNPNWGADWNDDLKAVAEYLGIPDERRLFAGEGLKSTLAKQHGVQLHIDDDNGWVTDVRQVCPCVWFSKGAAGRCLEELENHVLLHEAAQALHDVTTGYENLMQANGHKPEEGNTYTHTGKARQLLARLPGRWKS